jgi:hypothetical protein
MTMDPIFPQPGRAALLSLPAWPRISTLPASTPPVGSPPVIAQRGRISRITTLGREDTAAGLLWLAMNFPAVCDAMLDKVEFDAIDDEHFSREPEPFCVKCGASVGIFLAHGKEYRHYRGVLSATSKPKPYKTDHAPVVAWRIATAVTS